MCYLNQQFDRKSFNVVYLYVHNQMLDMTAHSFPLKESCNIKF
jgi:hypothetical protein